MMGRYGPRAPRIVSGELFNGVYGKRKGKPKVSAVFCPACGKPVEYCHGAYNANGFYTDLYCVCMHCGGNFRFFDAGDGGHWYKVGMGDHGVEVPGDA